MRKGIIARGGMGIALFLLLAVPVAWSAEVAPPKVTPELLKQGEALFKKQCVVCHGPDGKGDGPAADFLFAKPRNFTVRMFKIRTTPSGSPPTDQDLFKTITNGMPGSAMPSFGFLSENDRWALIAVVKKLAKIEGKPERVISVPPEPPVTPEHMAQGKEVYKQMKCWECHGLEGRGDGPKAGEQVDDWGFPILPADYTRGVFKGGGTPDDIYMRFTAGVDGTPMPSFEDSLNEADRWALAHYVLSFMTTKKPAAQPKVSEILAKKVSTLPKDAIDPAWKNVSETTIPLMHLWQARGKAETELLKPHWQRKGDAIISEELSIEATLNSASVERKEAISSVSVRAVHDGKEIVFLLEWEDEEFNSSYMRHEDFSDGAAIMFSLSPEKPLPQQPHFTMGEKGGPVNIWYWRLDRQMDLAGFQDIEKFYPGMAIDDYPLESIRYPKRIETTRSMSGLEAHLPVTPAPSHDSVFITGWGAGNILSIPDRFSAIEDLNAEGFSTLTAQSIEDQDVRGLGFYVNGKWRAVFRREFSTKGKFDVQLGAGKAFPLAFAIWDGARGDRDGQKAVTIWNTLKIEALAAKTE